MKIKYLDHQRQAMEEDIREIREDLDKRGTPECFMVITVYKSEEVNDGIEIKRFWAGEMSNFTKMALLEHLKLDIYNNR